MALAKTMGIKAEIIITEHGSIDEEIKALEKAIEQKRIPKKENCLNGNCQRICEESELPNYLGQGWRVQAVLPSGKIVVSNEP